MKWITNLLTLLTVLCSLILTACDRSNEVDIRGNKDYDDDREEMTREVFASGSASQVKNKEIENFLLKLSMATRAEADFQVEEFFSIEAMLACLEKEGVLGGLNKDQRKQFIAGMNKGMRDAADMLKMNAFDEFKVLRVEEIDENEVLVYVTQYNNELNVTVKCRYWLVKEDSGLRIFDLEELSSGYRAVAIMGMLMAEMLNPPAEPWVSKFVELNNVMKQNAGDMFGMLQSVIEPSRELIDSNPPKKILGFGYLLLVSGIIMEDADEALKIIEEAEAADAVAPVLLYQKGAALSAVGRHEEALEVWEEYVQYLGRDSDILELMADAHYALDNYAKSKELALEGLEDNPRSVGCLISLVAVSEVEELKSERMLKRFVDTDNLETAYDYGITYLMDSGEAEKAEILYSQLSKKLPDGDVTEAWKADFEPADNDE